MRHTPSYNLNHDVQLTSKVQRSTAVFTHTQNTAPQALTSPHIEISNCPVFSILPQT
jgi:hypothetical protein